MMQIPLDQPQRRVAHHATLAERFWAKVEKRGPDDCWEWTAVRSRAGYGRFCINYQTHPAGRIAWALVHDGYWPDGMLACHTCDNPPCRNPAHIFPGTLRDNQLDAMQKGRWQPYVRAPRTHCDEGHALSGDNLTASGHCKACRRDYKREWARRVAAAKRVANAGKPRERPVRVLPTHCKHGHEYTPENTFQRADGARVCRTCRRRADSAYAQRQRTEVAT
jgi:hypothetical protein